MREIAVAAGAPVAKVGCTPNNVEIEFTGHPQALISLAQKRNWILPGYHFASQDKKVGEMSLDDRVLTLGALTGLENQIIKVKDKIQQKKSPRKRKSR